MTKEMKFLTIWLVVGIAAIGVFVLFFDHVFPNASIDINFSKEEASELAEGLIAEHGFDLEGFDEAIIFSSDYGASVYLQKTQGIKRSNELIEQGIPVWYWRQRWFKELQKDGFTVGVDPASGEVVYFRHAILEDSPSANLSRQAAQALAEAKVASFGIDLNDYELKDSVRKEQKNRTDYSFEWEKRNYKISDATLRVAVSIYGDELGSYAKYLKIPEEFVREFRRETTLGNVLTKVSSTLTYLLLIAAVAFLVIKVKPRGMDWKFGATFALAVMTFEILAFFNSIPLLWNFYPDTMSKGIFFTMSLEGAVTGAISTGLMIFAFATLGELLSRNQQKTRIPLITALRSKTFNLREITPIFVVGYSLGFIFLGYITLFYLFGTKFFNIWMPPNTAYSNILGTAMPFLFPLTLALGAALSEEFIYRLLGISFFRRISRFTLVAVIAPAVLWGFAHSSYHIFPTYVRGLELTIFGIILGLVYLKYGIETVIIAHFVIDAALAGLPLLKSGNSYFIISGVIVILLAFVPLGAILVVSSNRMRRA